MRWFDWNTLCFCFMQMQSYLNHQCGTKLLAFGSLNPKSVTPAFDHLVGGGCGFGDPEVMVAFWFDEGMIFGPMWPLSFYCLLSGGWDVQRMQI
jgi:hypothetical protein